jgi:hypothetical protein
MEARVLKLFLPVLFSAFVPLLAIGAHGFN